jgi:hypothetical protein
MVSKEEFLKYRQDRHRELQMQVQEDEKKLIDFPYLDNIP